MIIWTYIGSKSTNVEYKYNISIVKSLIYFTYIVNEHEKNNELIQTETNSDIIKKFKIIIQCKIDVNNIVPPTINNASIMNSTAIPNVYILKISFANIFSTTIITLPIHFFIKGDV
ncbi:Uncharacterised protein [uncultured archaeon]|nr:Uncharacterised protein [uncultured archaeon]